MDTPVKNLAPEHIHRVLWGSGSERILLRHQGKSGRRHEYRTQYEGVIPNIERRFRETESDFIREDLQRYMAPRPCPTCHGSRLKPEALAVTIAGRNVNDAVSYSVLKARAFFSALENRQPFEEERRNGRLGSKNDPYAAE